MRSTFTENHLPCEITCTKGRHRKREREKHQPQRAEVGCQLPGTSVEDASPSKMEGRDCLDVIWSTPITPESLPGRFGKDKPAVWGTGFQGWAGAQPDPQGSSLSWLNLEVQSSWQEGQFKQQEPELRLSSIQMKTRDCSKWFSTKQIKKSRSPFPTSAVRNQ